MRGQEAAGSGDRKEAGFTLSEIPDEPGHVFTIDPGPLFSGWACLRILDKNPVAFGIAANRSLKHWLKKYYERKHIHLLAIEVMQFYGMSVGESVFESCYWIGRFMEAHPEGTLRITRGQVKMAVCRSPKANDSNIRQALIDRYGPRGTKKNPGILYRCSGDAWSAIAIGVTVLETLCHNGRLLENPRKE